MARRYFGIATPKNINSLCLYAVACVLLLSAPARADEPVKVYDLAQTIERAIEVHLRVKLSQDEIEAADAAKKSQKTNFYPTFSAAYQYTRNYETVTSPYFGVLSPENEYVFVTSVKQPLFTGFSILNRYEIAALGLDVAKINEKLVRQNIIFEANNIYFSVLKAQKLLTVAEDTVKQIESQTDVARNFYQVGMTPLNDLLQAQVELANAQQNLVIAQNNLEAAGSNFNTFLRRPINAPVQIQDVLAYTPLEKDLDYCLETAQQNRLELQIADRKVEIAEKELKLAKKDYYPTVMLEGNIYSLGTDWNVDGGAGISDPHRWDIQATAQWNFWEWGRTTYGVKEKLSRLSQAGHEKAEVQETLILEVKKAFLKTIETEKNIATAEKAIEQAKENLRINQERYKEQVATTTDVLDAQTLLSRTMTNYYNALYDLKISKASLSRAMGREAME
ncbi:MAG: TolC family protein [Desulfobacterales bacterium]|nr:TolC family protein [Desulfobacterales bacterium]